MTSLTPDELDDFQLTAAQLIAMGGGYHLIMTVREQRQAAVEIGDDEAVAAADQKLQIIDEIEDRRMA